MYFGYNEQEVVDGKLLDKFIDRALKENDETLYSLAGSLLFRLRKASMVSYEELRIYPQVISRCEERMKNGEK